MQIISSNESVWLAQVYLFGACVTSWKQNSGDEVLFIRPDAKFDGSKPISGGIPHCFPQVSKSLTCTIIWLFWSADFDQLLAAACSKQYVEEAG